MHSFDINLKNISKLEGHTDLDVKVRKGKVKECKLRIVEHKRFIEHSVLNKSYQVAPQITSRICGTCSIAHLLATIEAIEKAFNVKVSKQIIDLRKLLMYGLQLRDHALHLYIFSLPDIFGKDSILDFSEDDKTEHELVHDCFDVKATGNNLCNWIGGRAVHSPYPVVGGFTKFPDLSEKNKIISQLKSVRKKVLKLIDIFYKCPFKSFKETKFISLVTPDFSYLEGYISGPNDEIIKEKDYAKHLVEKVKPYTQAEQFTFGKDSYMVGALARMNNNRNCLNKKTKKDVKKYLGLFPSENIFDNNVAQAIEMLHCIDQSVDMLKSIKIKPEKLKKIVPKKSEGVGVVEAPRGTLYHHYKFDKEGKITYSEIIVPTGQNQINIESDIKEMIENNLDMDKKKLSFEIEKLIRAYDICSSCATHFLKINWK